MSSATDSAEMISENRISLAVMSRVEVGGLSQEKSTVAALEKRLDIH